MMSERGVRITLIIVDLLAALSAFVGAVGLVALAILPQVAEWRAECPHPSRFELHRPA